MKDIGCKAFVSYVLYIVFPEGLLLNKIYQSRKKPGLSCAVNHNFI